MIPALPASREGRPYGRLSFDGRRWVVSGLEPHVAIRLKSMFPQLDKAQVGTFTFGDHENVCADLYWFMQRYPLDMEFTDQRRLDQRRTSYARQQRDLEEILLPTWSPPSHIGFRPPFTPWLPQAQAIEVARRRRSLLLGDVMGGGKTDTALGVIAGSEFLPAAYVTKSHLATQLVQNFVEPHTYMSAHIVEGTTPYSLPAANIYVFKYTNIAGWSDVIAEGFFNSAIFDEVHELRHGVETQKGKAAKVLADIVKLRLGMSGTPIFNYGDEIYNILEILSPGVLGERDEFYREWCIYRGQNKWFVRDPDALGTYLREVGVYLRRVRDGRPVNKHMIEVPFDFSRAAESSDLTKALAIRTLTGSFTERGQAARELDSRLRMETGIGKADGVAAFARMLLSQDQPIVLFGWHREVYDRWLEVLQEFKPVMHTGSETSRKKERSKAAFLNGDTNCMIMSLRSGDGVDGLQQRCSKVVFGEYDWSPEVHSQAIGRVDRPGQPEPAIDAFYCYVEEGSDPSIMSVHGVKSTQARGINDPMAGSELVTRDEARVRMLAKNYLDSIGVAM